MPKRLLVLCCLLVALVAHSSPKGNPRQSELRWQELVGPHQGVGGGRYGRSRDWQRWLAQGPPPTLLSSSRKMVCSRLSLCSKKPSPPKIPAPGDC